MLDFVGLAENSDAQHPNEVVPINTVCSNNFTSHMTKPGVSAQVDF